MGNGSCSCCNPTTRRSDGGTIARKPVRGRRCTWRRRPGGRPGWWRSPVTTGNTSGRSRRELMAARRSSGSPRSLPRVLDGQLANVPRDTGGARRRVDPERAPHVSWGSARRGVPHADHKVCARWPCPPSTARRSDVAPRRRRPLGAHSSCISSRSRRRSSRGGRSPFRVPGRGSPPSSTLGAGETKIRASIATRPAKEPGGSRPFPVTGSSPAGDVRPCRTRLPGLPCRGRPVGGIPDHKEGQHGGRRDLREHGSGKSTLFRSLSGAAQASAREERGGVRHQVPDERVDRLAEIFRPKKVTYISMGSTTSMRRDGLFSPRRRSPSFGASRSSRSSCGPSPTTSTRAPGGLARWRNSRTLLRHRPLRLPRRAERIERMTKEAKPDAEWTAAQGDRRVRGGRSPAKRRPLGGGGTGLSGSGS